MSTLRRTELRHRMLTAINSGRVKVYVGIGDSLVVDGKFCTGPEKRTEFDVLPLVQRNRSSRMGDSHNARLTNAGRALLSEWDTKHGKVES